MVAEDTARGSYIDLKATIRDVCSKILLTGSWAFGQVLIFTFAAQR